MSTIYRNSLGQSLGYSHKDGSIKQADVINSMTSPISIYSILDEQIPYGPFRIKELIGFASSIETKKNILKVSSN